MKKSSLIFVVFLICLPALNAISIEVFAPQYITQAQDVIVNFTINSAQNLNGTVYLSFTGVNSSTSIINFVDSDFTSQYFSHAFSIKGAAPGEFSIYARLQDPFGATLSFFNKTGIVNSSMPRIIFSSPSGIISKESTVLIASTDETSTCKYDTTDRTYDNMSDIFSNTGNLNHNQTLSGLGQGEHTFYIRCKDTQGYAMNTSEIVKFMVDLPPTAQISLSQHGLVREGIIEVTLQTSKDLENAPELEYAFNDAPSSRKPISLTGSDSLWKGYLIITQLDDNKVGTFYFSGIDSQANIGTKITLGNIFIVDTTKPPMPQSIKAVSEPDGSIKLNWYYSGEDIDYFNIYRATGTGVNYVDFNSKSNGSSEFIDDSTIDKVTYYYKVSAIDKAGNEGPLSDEVFATSINKAQPNQSVQSIASSTDSDVPKVLPPNLVPKVDTYIKKIEKQIIDVRDTITQLQAMQGDKKELVDELGLADEAQSAKSKLDALQAQLEGFKQNYATAEELDQKLNSVDLESKKLEATTPKDAEIIEKSDFIQSTSNDDIDKAANELFKDITFTQDEKNTYIKKNQNEKDKINVNISVKVASVLYLDGSRQDKTFILKKLSYRGQEQLNDVILIESIPKTMAATTGEIDFLGKKYEVVQDDPVVKIGFLKFNPSGEEVSYRLGKKISADDVKNSKSVMLLSLNELAKDQNKVTGLFVSSFSLGLDKTQTLFVWAGIITIICLAAYYLLFVKDYKYLLKKMLRGIKIRRERIIVGNKTEDVPSVQKLPDATSSSGADLGQDANRLLSEMYLHIKDAKADLADNLLPLFASLNNKLESSGFGSDKLGQKNTVFVNSLINQAHSYLDSGMHEEAARLYPRISFIYQNLPKENRSEIFSRCTELHKRIDEIGIRK